MGDIISYRKKNFIVFGDKNLKGKAEVYSLCNRCEKSFYKDIDTECMALALIKSISMQYGTFAPIFDCANFKLREDKE
ncbi:hypothetical protein M0R19_04655 [Candidatus Pacearchaeota archaeon]|nr:hypothetical protein [Candidatus Pacearchaeota archaeon]